MTAPIAGLLLWIVVRGRCPLLLEFRSDRREFGLEMLAAWLLLFASAVFLQAPIGEPLVDAVTGFPLASVHGLGIILAVLASITPQGGLAADGLKIGFRLLRWRSLKHWEWQGDELVLQFDGRLCKYLFNPTSRPRVEAAMREITAQRDGGVDDDPGTRTVQSALGGGR